VSLVAHGLMVKWASSAYPSSATSYQNNSILHSGLPGASEGFRMSFSARMAWVAHRLALGLRMARPGVLAITAVGCLVGMASAQAAGGVDGARALLTLLLALAALWWPIRGFLAVLPNISQLYNHPQQPAWGMWMMVAGLTSLIILEMTNLWRVRD